MAVFDCLPLGATVETPAGTFLCLHGGISPGLSVCIECLNELIC